MNRKLKFIARARKNLFVVILLTASSITHADDLKVTYINEPEASAKAQMLEHILEVHTDYRVTLKKTVLVDMWTGVAEGHYDCSVSVFLPAQQKLMDQFSDRIEDLGPNWLGPDFSIHTIVNKKYARENSAIVRFLNNYCLCGDRLQSVMALNVDGEITRQEAIKWMDEHESWITNMMGFERPFDDREQRNVTY